MTPHWAFLFWYQQHLRNLPDLAAWSARQRGELVSLAMLVIMAASIVGNFAAAWLARALDYHRAIALFCFGYFASMVGTYAVPRGHAVLMALLPVIGFCAGLFALFTMYLPPLFPTLLRTTGAGFCYNIGRVVAAVGTVAFGLFSQVGDYRLALFYAGFLFLPAALIALRLPEPNDLAPPQAEGRALVAELAD
jgi:MFS family permease